MTRWRHQEYGTEADPIRQSDLNDIASAYGCSRRFQLRKRAEAGQLELTSRQTARGRTCLGTAVHETFRLYLSGDAGRRILAGELPRADAVLVVLRRELERAAAGELIEWYGEDPAEMLAEACCMVCGALAAVQIRAAEVVLVEAPFTLAMTSGTGTYHLRGTVDLAYRPRGARRDLVLVDWKSGQQRLPQVILDYGYQIGIYAEALRAGVFYPGTEAERRIEQFPDEAYVVHLRDFVPYKRATTKTADRPEEAAFFGVERGAKVKLPAGALRGPGWYAAKRTVEDVARLRVSIRQIVSSVRLGCFVEFIDEHCGRCEFRGPCLQDGYALDRTSAEAKELERALRGINVTGLDDEVAA